MICSIPVLKQSILLQFLHGERILSGDKKPLLGELRELRELVVSQLDDGHKNLD